MVWRSSFSTPWSTRLLSDDVCKFCFNIFTNCSLHIEVESGGDDDDDGDNDYNADNDNSQLLKDDLQNSGIYYLHLLNTVIAYLLSSRH
jgi:hypothetical protein